MVVIISVRALLAPISVFACQVTHSKMMARPAQVCTLQLLCQNKLKISILNLNIIFNAGMFVLAFTCFSSILAIDLCVEDKHDCEQICISSPGIFNCDCNAGYALRKDNRTCTS